MSITLNIKNDVLFNEYWLHKLAYNLCSNLYIPKIMNYHNNTLSMVKINSVTIADEYGADKQSWNNLPKWIKIKIYFIIRELYNIGIVYPDINGYNFIQKNNKIWVTNFRHAFNLYENHNDTQKKRLAYIQDILKNPEKLSWNSYFL